LVYTEGMTNTETPASKAPSKCSKCGRRGRKLTCVTTLTLGAVEAWWCWNCQTGTAETYTTPAKRNAAEEAAYQAELDAYIV
jgi:hypothetical protein